MTAGTRYNAEIREQPSALRRLLTEGRPGVEAIAEHVRQASPAYAVLAARGSSDNAARYAQYTLGTLNGLTVALAAPSLFTLYGARPNMKSALAIGISQSGQSPDIVSVIDAAREQGSPTLAITNDPDSPLAKAASHCIPLRAGEEKAVAATKTYTTELMALAMFSAALSGDATRWADLEKVPEQVERTIELNSDASAARAFAGIKQLVVIGRGFNYSTAFETSLKIKETNYIVAEPYSVADLLHGPVAMIGEGFPVLLVAPRGATSVDVPELLATIDKRRARLSMVISDDPELLARAELGLRLPAGIPEWLSPIAAVVAGQLFAGALAEAHGLDPDQPRGLSKVTLTR